MNWLIKLLLHRGNDLSTYFIPHAYFFKRSLLELHQLPLWNPIQFTGIPYLADPQNFIFYLPNYAFVLLGIETAFIILLFTHLIWAGIGTYFLANRHFKLSRLPAIFAGLIFVLTPKIFSHLEAGHYTMLVAFSWLPWFMLVAFKFLSQPTFRLSVILAFVSALMYFNYIHILYLSLLFLATYSLFLLIRTKFKRFKKYLILNTFYLILFLTLISPNLIAQLQFAPLSTRNLITYQDVAQPLWSFKLFFQNLFFPFFLDHQELATERVLFPGLVVWILATIGWLRHHHPRRWFFLGWLIFSLFFALGDRIPFFIFFYKFFPLIQWFRVTTRLWIITNLFLAVFAGLGLPKKLYAIYALMLLSFVDIAFINFRILQKPIILDSTPASFYQIIAQDKNQPFRVYCTTGCFSLQKLGELGIYSLSGNNPIQSKQFVDDLQYAAGYSYSKYTPVLPPYEVFSLKPQPNSKAMKSLNTKYVASPYPLTDPEFTLIHQDNSYLLYTVK